ncbi:MAG: thiosulfate oxidation carrier protein SoxY [Alphaproteobacteria bacterium]|nr:thiosulfate oxidation carrier protein SoxY [Alphaproteobacteria bacterium]
MFTATQHKQTTSRRTVVIASAAAALAALLPRLSSADPAAVTAALKKLYGDKPMTEGRIKLDVPPIAENGLVVPLNVEVESPMSETDYVTTVHVFADGNPLPGVVSYHFQPGGKASAGTRVRLAQTQNVVCVAEMSNGQVYMAKANVKVTIGGCGG